MFASVSICCGRSLGDEAMTRNTSAARARSTNSSASAGLVANVTASGTRAACRRFESAAHSLGSYSRVPTGQ